MRRLSTSDPAPAIRPLPPLPPQVEAPAFFPPSFLYTQSWEDPRTDEPHLQVGPGDVCLTLTSGGCNSLHLCIAGARKVRGVGGGAALRGPAAQACMQPFVFSR